MGGGFTDGAGRRRLRRLLCEAAMPCGLSRRVVYDVESATFLMILGAGDRPREGSTVIEFHDDGLTARDIVEMVEIASDLMLGAETVDGPVVDQTGMGVG